MTPAERQRLRRDRAVRGVVVLDQVEVDPDAVEVLVDLGLLLPGDAADRAAVRYATNSLLSRLAELVSRRDGAPEIPAILDRTRFAR